MDGRRVTSGPRRSFKAVAVHLSGVTVGRITRPLHLPARVSSAVRAIRCALRYGPIRTCRHVAAAGVAVVGRLGEPVRVAGLLAASPIGFDHALVAAIRRAALAARSLLWLATRLRRLVPRRVTEAGPLLTGAWFGPLRTAAWLRLLHAPGRLAALARLGARTIA